jgi:hypothetical protein
MAKDARTWEQHADEIRREIRAAEDRGDGISAREWAEAFSEAQTNAELAKQNDTNAEVK